MTTTRIETPGGRVLDGRVLDDRASANRASDGRVLGDRVARLRGAGVEVDGRRVAHVLALICLVFLATLVVVLFASGIRKNSQIDRLRSRGVPVEVTVTGCLGELGGSGSNAAGYSCKGTFVIDGQRHEEPIPGSTLYPPGTQLRALAVPGDPALVSPVTEVMTEHASESVFVLPGVLTVFLVLGTVLFLVRLRAKRWRAQPGGV